MSLKDTFKHMKELLANITSDLDKSENGNKAASQRVRTGTVRLEKVAKLFRKESIASEKKNKGQKKPAKAPAAKKSGAAKAKAPAKSKAPVGKASSSAAKKPAPKAKPKAKTSQASVKARPFSVKRKR